MTVDPATAAGSALHEGTTYYFCSRHCLATFEADPGKYVAPALQPEGHSCCSAKPARPVPEMEVASGAKWTCPICEACGEECARHEPAHCRRCAEECRACAEECRRMAGVAA